MKRIATLTALTAALMVPTLNTAPANAGTRFCFNGSGNRICIKKGRRYDRICVTFYMSFGTMTKCHRRYHRYY